MTAVPVTTPATQPKSWGASTARNNRRSTLWSKVRRDLQRRRHQAEQMRHDRQPTTDAYVDRHGEPGIDARSFAAFFSR